MSLPKVRKLAAAFLSEIEAEERAGTIINPYRYLAGLLADKNHLGETIVVPLSVKVAAAAILIRVRLPNLASSSNTNSNSLDGSIELRNQPVSRVQILDAIMGIQDPAQREVVMQRAQSLFNKTSKPLLLEAEAEDDDQ